MSPLQEYRNNVVVYFSLEYYMKSTETQLVDAPEKSAYLFSYRRCSSHIHESLKAKTINKSQKWGELNELHYALMKDHEQYAKVYLNKRMVMIKKGSLRKAHWDAIDKVKRVLVKTYDEARRRLDDNK